MESKHRDWFGSHDEFLLEMDKKKDAATAEFQNNQRDIAKASIAGMIKSGVFTTTTGAIDMESVQGRVNQLTEDPVENEALMDYARSIGDQTIVGNKKAFDVSTGEAAADFTDKMITKTLTSDYVWGAKIPVPVEYESDAASFRNKWANIAQGLVDRQIKESDTKTKKAIEDAYSPDLAGSLRSDARAAETKAARDAVKLRASEAFTASPPLISEADYGAIVKDADTSFDTAFGSEQRSLSNEFRSVMNAKYSPEAMLPWVKAQVLASQQRGEEVDTSELIGKFQTAAQSRQWVVNQYDDNVRLEIERLGIDNPTIDQLREISLKVQKRFLGKTDTELVDMYNIWLKQ
jgi:hypothetical protein